VKRPLCLFLVTLIFYSFTYGKEYDKAYEKKFNEVRDKLGKGRTGEAYILLKDLYKIDPTNYYTNYLMGVCYTEQNIITEQSIKHLEYAKDSIIDEYKYIPYNETRAPIFAWYYLTKAYSQNGYCAKARWAKGEFLKYDTDFTGNSFFLNNIEQFMIDCEKNKAILRNKKRKESVVTKPVQYSVMQPLYGVQVGAFKDLVPIREEFDDLKNVEAFMDKEGTLRYVIGHFSTKSQATYLLAIIKETGYKDAFIVDVNEQKRFSNEVIIVDNMSFKTHISGDIEYRVQIGAFKDSIPNELAEIYLKVDNIDEIEDNGLTLLQVGHWEAYNDAVYKRSILKGLGIPGPFIVAYDKNQKLSIKAAQKHQARIQKEESQKQIEKEGNKKRNKKGIKDGKQKQFE
jgi:hypothetical protein